jgi:aminoglycoside phosphotransferase family enzyme
LSEVEPLLIARGSAGHVRRCHGDLHLRNIVLLDGEPTLFDAIEFDDAVATGDVLYDLAFLLMDLWEGNLREAGNIVLNRYLWESDEAHVKGLAALPFLSIRAAIRAKVTAAGLPHIDAAEQERAAAEAIHPSRRATRRPAGTLPAGNGSTTT